MAFIGYKRDTLENFYLWQGNDQDPAIGTVNEILGFNSSTKPCRYTYPVLHKDSTCEFDSNGMPLLGTIQGQETDVIFVIDSGCPAQKIPSGLLTKEEYNVLDWVSSADN